MYHRIIVHAKLAIKDVKYEKYFVRYVTVFVCNLR